MCEICGNPHFDFRFVSGPVPDYIQNDIDRYPLRPGMQINVRRHGAHKGLREQWEVHSDTFLFSFPLSGDMTVNIDGDPASSHLADSVTNLSYMPGRHSCTEYHSSKTVRWVGIVVDRNTMGELLNDGSQPLMPTLFRLINSEKDPYLYRKAPMTTAMRQIAHQIYNNSMQGALGNIFLEGKALELVSLRLHQLFEVTEPTPPSLNSTDIERIYHARELLEKQMVAPPSLFRLAKKAGLNDTKLKRGFKQVFGTTVFDYLKNVRLESARQLLLAGEKNVSEVAAEVGYNSLSHFSQIFKRKYGILPSRISKSG